MDPLLKDRGVSFIGFGYLDSQQATQEFSFRAIWLPHWFLALLFAVLPAVRVRAMIRNRRRFGAGLCPACGYDLRATPGRCPECGAEVTHQVQSTK
jgi:hypothetical protein